MNTHGQRAEMRLGLEIAEPPRYDLINAVLLSCDRFHEVPPNHSRVFREAVNDSGSSFYKASLQAPRINRDGNDRY